MFRNARLPDYHFGFLNEFPSLKTLSINKNVLPSDFEGQKIALDILKLCPQFEGLIIIDDTPRLHEPIIVKENIAFTESPNYFFNF